LIILHTKTNQKQADTVEESRERRIDHQGVSGVCYSIDLGGDLNNRKIQNINTLALAGRKHEDAAE